MQVSSSTQNVNYTSNIQAQSNSLTASRFMEQLGEEISSLFDEMSVGLDEDTKLKRALSLSFHLSNPMFMSFKEGYPDDMPQNVKTALEQQKAEYLKLTDEKEKNIYKLDWMINHIDFKDSSDPEFETFLKDLRNKYAGTELSYYKSRDEINDEDSALQKFKNDLITKGALKFVYDFNMEKIEEMVQKYKDKLLKEMEENPELDLDIDKMVAEYKKQLLERLAELEDEEDKSVLNINRVEFDIVNKLNPKLEDILQEI